MRLMMKMMIAAAALAGVPAAAATIVDSSPRGSQDPSGFYPAFVGGGSANGSFQVAAAFTLAADYVLSSIEYFGGGTGPAAVHIRQDGATPGASLFSKTFDTVSADNGRVWNGVYSLGWSLAAGTYFVSFESPDQGSAFLFETNFENPLDRELLCNAQSGCTTLAQNFSSFDERYRSGLGIRIAGDRATAAVPEPATWALLIGGVGLTGGALRRRRAGVRVSFG